MVTPIRILHVFGIMDTGGAESLIMEIYRNLKKEQFQFDFLVHGNSSGYYESEIEKLGGKIYRVSKYKGYNHLRYKKELDIFFETHREFSIVHSHIRSTANIILKIAKKNGKLTISHAHSTSDGKGLASQVKSVYRKQITKYSDVNIACSADAGK